MLQFCVSLRATIHGGGSPSADAAIKSSLPPRGRPTLIRQLSQPAMTMEGMYLAKQQTNPRIPIGRSKLLPAKSSENIDSLLKDLRRESKRNLFAKVNNSTPASKRLAIGHDSDDDSVEIVLKTK